MAETKYFGRQAKYISPPYFDPEVSPPPSPKFAKYRPE